ncbi:hypothetical protein F4820DRAFT_308165 [Hypoxylon rubiginosum]|uniref:Uncharacterized protein n=1 Tax=Hypoxylon rubiginosum TaxID=110542 RepID=A0ACB9Z1Q4_9PEZI|nr:hypothetical protein F4820DRAFT_308165 [Hypoxylon rubiginosum]
MHHFVTLFLHLFLTSLTQHMPIVRSEAAASDAKTSFVKVYRFPSASSLLHPCCYHSPALARKASHDLGRLPFADFESNLEQIFLSPSRYLRVGRTKFHAQPTTGRDLIPCYRPI